MMEPFDPPCGVLQVIRIAQPFYKRMFGMIITDRDAKLHIADLSEVGMQGGDLLSVPTLVAWRQAPRQLAVEMRDKGTAATNIF